MLAGSVILMRIFGRYVDNHYFWLIALGVPVAFWIVFAGGRFAIWMLKDMKANGYDKRREAWIISETRRSRRALQILNVSFITGYPAEHQDEVVTKILSNASIIAAQTDWQGTEGRRMSRIAVSPDETPSSLISLLFDQLTENLALHLTSCSDKASLTLAFDISSTVPHSEVIQLWGETWEESGIALPVEYIKGSGPGIVDNWLNNHFKDNAMLLVVALQVAPVHVDNSAEVAVALLFGNRLTQESVSPLALLHRPDPSPARELEFGMRMAAYNVPVKDGIVRHLWLSGLNDQQHAEVVIHQNKPPAKAVEGDAVINLDSTMGHAGAAAPWLAIAAATEITQLTQSPQMIICGDTTQDVLWSTLVTPTASRQEIDS
ncbi:hypothetical protein [Buttiauxella sp. S19-1]|uniref:hypothetical protein n=1 Tax=Buttiauxella sp. S19-1 TaxID=941430 RepID=UPI00235A1841|nr:hypothetical protein [Buttiauxella sp. S19-1]